MLKWVEKNRKSSVSQNGASPFLLIILLLAGCAHVPPRPAPIGSSLLAARLTIGSVNYLPSSLVAKELGATVQVDPETQVWSIASGSHRLHGSPQIPAVVIDDAVHSLEAPPLLQDGELLLPESVWTRWLSSWRASARQSSAGFPRPIGPYPFKTIVLDPGHGGYDVGALGRNGLREKTVVLDVALRLRDLLERDGFHVVMTRSDDHFISLSRRSEIANREGEGLFISIHANASRRRSASGFEVYRLADNADDYARSMNAVDSGSLPPGIGDSVSPKTQAIVWDLLYTEHRAGSTELAGSVCWALKSNHIPSQNRGVKSARFAVLKGSRMPAVLIEVGFVTHPAEAARLRTAGYRQQLAEGIRKGIVAFEADYERHSTS